MQRYFPAAPSAALSLATSLAAALLAAGCSPGTDRQYAHDSVRYRPAAERMFGTTGGELATAPSSSTAGATPVAPAPAVSGVPQPAAMVAPSDAGFVQRVAAANSAEIDLARLAYVRAQSPEVRAFARQMIVDHRDLSVRLDSFALERGYLIAWQVEPDKVETIRRLSALSGAAFDRAYMDEMVAAHEQAVATLEAQAASGRTTASVAREALPTVRHHLEMARALDARL